MIPAPELGVDGPPRSKSNPKPPSCYCSSSGECPRMIVTSPYIWHVKPVMMYTDDTRVASSNVTLSSQVSSMGDKWQETGHTHKLQAHEGHTTEF